MKINKVLIIRFSSFGDIVQCSPVVELIRQKEPGARVDWVTRSEFESLVKLNTNIGQVWPFDRKLGLVGILNLGFKLRAENYDHVYDAHNNLRSKLLMMFIRLRLFNRPLWLTRSKHRVRRILLFSFRMNTFPKPFKGILSYVEPLKKWGIEPSSLGKRVVNWNFPVGAKEKAQGHSNDEKTITLVPGAAWEMKRWPLESWKKLIELLPQNKFIVLGGKEDFQNAEGLKAMDPLRVKNLAGQLSLIESCALIEHSSLVVSADTGLLHVADVLGIKALSLMGPTAFGFTLGEQVLTLEVDLPCRPCTKDGRGRCSQAVYQRCMVEITPDKVAAQARRLLL